jgi:hypothetical protein
VDYADQLFTGSKDEVKKYDRRRLNDLRWEHRSYVRPRYLALLLFISFELRDSYHHGARWIKIKLPEIMHELFIRDFSRQLKANDMDLHIALTKLESLIFDDTLNTATSNCNFEDLMNEQTSYSYGRNFLEWIRAIEPPYTYEPIVNSMIQWWYRLKGTFKTRITFPVWFGPFRPSDARRLSEQFVTPPSGMVTQVQQLTRGRLASESSAGSAVCRSTQVMLGTRFWRLRWPICGCRILRTMPILWAVMEEFRYLYHSLSVQQCLTMQRSESIIRPILGCLLICPWR